MLPSSPPSPNTIPLTLGVALRVFLPFALGYFLSYVFRTVNSIIAPNLAQDVGLRADELGLLTSVFFLSFALFQLPLGLLLDRFGPRRVEAALLLFAAVGALVFALADSLAGLSLGRALIGLGVSACLMGSFKAFVQWFAPARLPLVNSALLACGALGALAATLPVEWALQFTGWRGVFVGVAGFALLVALAVGVVVPEHGDPPVHTTLGAQLQGVGEIFRSRFFWAVAPVSALSQAAFLSVQGLWAGPWLRDVAGLPRQAVAEHLALMAIAIVAGFILIGALTDRLQRRRVEPLTVAVVGIALFIGVQVLLIVMPVDWAAPLWATFGFLGTTSTLSYAVLSQAFSRHLAGRVNTALNLLVFLGAFLLQWGLGAILHLWEDPVGHTYGAEGYDVALGMLAGLQALALAWLFLIRRK